MILIGSVAAQAASNSTVVLMYHRLGDSQKPATNMGLSQFEAHLRELALDRYQVLPLVEVVAAMRAGAALPDRTVAITFDGATNSVYREAWPRLVAAGLPFTVFMSTDEVDNHARGFMNWDQVRRMVQSGVTFAVATCSHSHLPALAPAEALADIVCGAKRFEAEIGLRPALFGYPYGEASTAVVEMVRNAGYMAAFGDHSAPMNGHSDPFFLPRFPLDRSNADLAHLRLITGSQPLPVTEVVPADPSPAQNPPLVSFTVAPSAGSLDRLSCYASHRGPIRIERQERRVSVHISGRYPPTRGRLNCTLPTSSNRWLWFGAQFTFPK